MKIGFLSLGCPKNLVDGEVMLGIARDAGHEITPDASTADVLVVNTCAFIDRAKQESIDAILEMADRRRTTAARLGNRLPGGTLSRQLKGDSRSMRCLGWRGAQAWLRLVGETGDGIRDPGPDRHPSQSGCSAPRICPAEISPSPDRTRSDPNPTAPAGVSPDLRRHAAPADHAEPFRVVKIAEGCDYTCAFCIIPTLRGKYRRSTARRHQAARCVARRQEL